MIYVLVHLGNVIYTLCTIIVSFQSSYVSLRKDVDGELAECIMHVYITSDGCGVYVNIYYILHCLLHSQAMILILCMYRLGYV